MKISILATMCLAACAACPPKPNPDPIGPVPDAEITASDSGTAGDAPAAQPDASPAASVACANLRRLGCKEGLDPNCEVVFDRVLDAHLTDLRPACLTSAKTKAEARACKSVDCP